MFSLKRFTQGVRRFSPRRGTGHILFSTEEGTNFERIRLVTKGPHGESVLLAWRRPPRGQPELVVVKALSRPPRQKARLRWEEEARLVTHLSHPGIARVLGLYQQGHTRYAVSEFVEGTSLASVLDDAALCGRPPSEEFGLYVCAEVADALHHAHTLEDERGQPLGIVHRDVCPSNIRLTRGGQVKLTNLGVAWSRLAGREEMTEGGRRLGDEDYAPPEYLCERGGRVEASADLFSLGLVLLELVTGRHLYYVEPLERRVAHGRSVLKDFPHQDDAPLPMEELEVRADFFGPGDVEFATRGLSEPVREVLHKLLRREPSKRYATGAELRADLRRCLKGKSWWYGARRAARELARLTARAEPLRRAADSVATFRSVDGFDVTSEEAYRKP